MTETPIALARKAGQFLEEKGIENARYEAELLLASVLGVSRLELYLQYDRPLTSEEVDAFRTAVRRRLRHEPVQYIVGEVHFRELVLRVDRRVLIPRPETEVLVGEVLRWAAAAAPPPPLAGEEPGEEVAPSGGGGAAGLTALDVGTGSGAIALSLAYEGPFRRVVATDVSADALELAGENARRVGVADRVELRRGSLWEPVTAGERFDVVVSNPPYVSEAERPELPPEVRDWEPAAALFAPEQGLALLAALVGGAPARLRPGGLLALEVGLGQAKAVAQRIEEAGVYEPPRIVRDYAGRERVVLATLAARTS